MNLQLRHKVYAYITHRQHLLVFSHPFAPEAGIQVPGGTLEEGETPAEGALREAHEETGLVGLRLVSKIGQFDLELPWLGQLQRRHYFHMVLSRDPPQRWRHEECFPSDGTPSPIVLEFFWAALPDRVPELTLGHDRLLPLLWERLSWGMADAH